INLDELMPKVYKSDDKKRNYDDDIREFKEVIGGLFPWCLFRAQVISGDFEDLKGRAARANEESKKAYASRYRPNDVLLKEIVDVSSSILFYYNQQEPKVVQQYYNDHIRDNSSFNIPQRISLLRAGSRAPLLKPVLTELENSVYELIKGLKEGGPEEVAYHYISLARAILSSSKDDAAVYFEEAINVVSKFGDEIVERWEAVSA